VDPAEGLVSAPLVCLGRSNEWHAACNEVRVTAKAFGKDRRLPITDGYRG